MSYIGFRFPFRHHSCVVKIERDECDQNVRDRIIELVNSYNEELERLRCRYNMELEGLKLEYRNKLSNIEMEKKVPDVPQSDSRTRKRAVVRRRVKNHKSL